MHCAANVSRFRSVIVAPGGFDRRRLLEQIERPPFRFVEQPHEMLAHEAEEQQLDASPENEDRADERPQPRSRSPPPGISTAPNSRYATGHGGGGTEAGRHFHRRRGERHNRVHGESGHLAGGVCFRFAALANGDRMRRQPRSGPIHEIVYAERKRWRSGMAQRYACARADSEQKSAAPRRMIGIPDAALMSA